MSLLFTDQNAKNRLHLIIGCTSVLVLSVVGYVGFIEKQSTGKSSAAPTSIVHTTLKDTGVEANAAPVQQELLTLAEVWDKESVPVKTDETTKVLESYFDSVIDPDYLYAVLQDVELNEFGDVVLDHKALQALQLTLSRQRLKIDAVQLVELQEIIRVGLPGKAGDQIARVVADFFNYLGAKEEMGELQLGLQKPTHNDWQRQYQQLSQLREIYLGKHAAQSLFRQEDANNKYMISVMGLDQNPDVSEADKPQLREQATEALVAKLVDIDDWTVRYQSFKQDKLAMMQASGVSLAQAEKDQLLAKHFTLEEIEQLMTRNLDVML